MALSDRYPLKRHEAWTAIGSRDQDGIRTEANPTIHQHALTDCTSKYIYLDPGSGMR